MPIPITGLPAQVVPGDNDPLAIVDTSGAITKKITRANLLKGAPLPADTVTNVAITNNSVTLPKIDVTTFPYGMIGFSTFGPSGGWASAGANTDQIVPFDTLVAGSVGVTSPVVGQLQIPTAGNYTVTLRMNAVAGSGTILHIIQMSSDGGSNWTNITPFNNPVTFQDSRGLTISLRQRFPANARIRVTNNNSNNVRYSATNAASTAMASLTVAM